MRYILIWFWFVLSFFHNFYEIAEIIFYENFPPAFFNILKEPLLVQKQTIHQRKALDLGFNLASWKWAWHYQEGATPSRREKHSSAWGKKSCSTARGRGSLMVIPRPLSGCQIKAEIKGFLLVYRLFLYRHWFLPNFELKDFPEYTVTPCRHCSNPKSKWWIIRSLEDIIMFLCNDFVWI